MMPQSISVPLRFSDIDAFGHVGHANVIAMCQEHRTEMFAELALTIGKDLNLEQEFVVVSVTAVFRRPILLKDRLVDIDCGVSNIGRTSLTLEYRLGVHGTEAATVSAVLVFVADGAPRELNLGEREWFGSGKNAA